MPDIAHQIIVLIQESNLDTLTKTEWIDRLPTLSEENQRDLLEVLKAKTKAELDLLQQKNLEKLNQTVRDLKKLTDEGVKLIYRKGEESSRQKEVDEGENILKELETA